MTDIWSGNATRIERTQRDLPERGKKVHAVIIHTTGSGIVGKALKKDLDPLDYAASYYARKNSYASHYLVGYDGTVVGTVPENLVAYHAGVSKGRRSIYQQGRGRWPRHVKRGKDIVDTGKHQARYDDWLERWPDLDSPVDLLPGRGVNSQTIGVDFLAPLPGEKHPKTQIMWVRALVMDIVDRYNLGTVSGSLVEELEIPKAAVLRHADVDPLARSTARGGWDPPRYAFEALCAQLGIEAWTPEPAA